MKLTSEAGSRRLRTPISVVVPAYNCEATIAACIESLLSQSLAADEIVIVDDCSQDGTAAVASRFPVRLIRLDRNGGPGCARNIGAAASRGGILAFTDADCVAPRDWLAAITAPLGEEGVVAATGGYAGPVTLEWLPLLQHVVLRRRQRSLPREIQSTISSNFACLREAFEAVGGFPLYYRTHDRSCPIWGNEDEELGFLIVRCGGKVRWIRGVGVYHHFRKTVAGYLAQQRFYVERIVMSLFRFPEMRNTRSNYSRASGMLSIASTLGTGVGVMGLAAWAINPAEALVGWLAAGAISTALPVLLGRHVGSILELRTEGAGSRVLARSYAVLLLVDLAWLLGGMSGLVRSLGGFVSGTGQSCPTIAATAETLMPRSTETREPGSSRSTKDSETP